MMVCALVLAADMIAGLTDELKRRLRNSMMGNYIYSEQVRSCRKTNGFFIYVGRLAGQATQQSAVDRDDAIVALTNPHMLTYQPISRKQIEDRITDRRPCLDLRP